VLTIDGIIKPTGDTIKLQCHVIHSTASDFVLDHPLRRKNKTEFRRALVHDFDDKLTLNFDGDYPGGVKILGAVEIPEKLITGGIKSVTDFLALDCRVIQSTASDLMLDHASRRTNNTKFRRALVHDFGDKLTLNFGGDYPGGVQITGDTTANANFKVLGALTVATKIASSMDILTVSSKILKSEATDFMLDNPGRRKTSTPFRRALVHNSNDGLTINFAKDYPGGVQIEGDVSADSFKAKQFSTESFKAKQLSAESLQVDKQITAQKVNALVYEARQP
jgi:hypothetical protein